MWLGKSCQIVKDDKSALVEYDFDRSPTILVPGDWNSQDDRLLYYEGTICYKRSFDYQLADHARALDDTRLVSAALEKHFRDGVNIVDDEMGNHLDIVAFNQYTGWYGGSLEDAPDTKWDIKFNKPVVISEFGGGALQGLHGTIEERWTEEYQEYLYQLNLKMIERIPNIRGTSPWILADFRSPKRLLPGIQDGWNRKGLVSDNGIKKRAFYTLRSFYDKIDEKYE